MVAVASLAKGNVSVVPSTVKSTLPELPNLFLTCNAIDALKSAPEETTSKLIVPLTTVASLQLTWAPDPAVPIVPLVKLSVKFVSATLALGAAVVASSTYACPNVRSEAKCNTAVNSNCFFLICGLNLVNQI